MALHSDVLIYMYVSPRRYDCPPRNLILEKCWLPDDRIRFETHQTHRIIK